MSPVEWRTLWAIQVQQTTASWMYRSEDLDLGAISISMEIESIRVEEVLQRRSGSRQPWGLDPQGKAGRGILL